MYLLTQSSCDNVAGQMEIWQEFTRWGRGRGSGWASGVKNLAGEHLGKDLTNVDETNRQTEKEEAEPSRAGAMGGPQLMGSSPMLWTQNRTPSHLRKGKCIRPETVWPERGRTK